MTQAEKIAALVEHIKKEFPKGCKDVECDNCPLHGVDFSTTEYDLCELLSGAEAR